MEKLILNPVEKRIYQLVLKVMDGDGYITDTQKADVYLIHRSGFHLFVTRGRIIRALAGWRVVEVAEVE